jgi:hypothetical protein
LFQRLPPFIENSTHGIVIAVDWSSMVYWTRPQRVLLGTVWGAHGYPSEKHVPFELLAFLASKERFSKDILLMKNLLHPNSNDVNQLFKAFSASLIPASTITI